MTSVLRKLADSSRSRDWRLSLLPFIMGCVYLWLWHFGLPFDGRTLLLVALSLVTATGFAALGYFINEFFDQRHDAMAGKPNRITQLSGGQRMALLLTTVTAAFAPWLWLPADTVSWALMATQVLLFLIYSLPFPRLKAVPVASNMVDMAYAYLVPLLLSFRTYMLFAEGKAPDWLWPLMAAVVLIGFRNILIHQVNDLFSDRRAGMNTLPQVLGPKNTASLLTSTILIESACFFAFGYWVMDKPFSSIILIAHLTYLVLQVKTMRQLVHNRFLPLDDTRYMGNLFYQGVFPLILLCLLTMEDARWLLLSLVHAGLLMPPEAWQRARIILSDANRAFMRFRSWLRAILSASVNYPIYWAFRLFGVDLIREQRSAIEFLRSRFS